MTFSPIITPCPYDGNRDNHNILIYFNIFIYQVESNLQC